MQYASTKLKGFDDFGTTKWYSYLLNLSMDSSYAATAGGDGIGYSAGSNILYQGILFCGMFIPRPEGEFISTTSFPTRRKSLVNTGYSTGVVRTLLYLNANFIINRSLLKGLNVFGNNFNVTIPTEQVIVSAGGGVGISSLVHTCILKKVDTAGTVTSLKTLTLSATNGYGNFVNYTFTSSGGIGSVSDGDVLFIEYTATFTGGAHSNTGTSETYSIYTNGTMDNILTSIP